jgi:hypothetical protein
MFTRIQQLNLEITLLKQEIMIKEKELQDRIDEVVKEAIRKNDEKVKIRNENNKDKRFVRETIY